MSAIGENPSAGFAPVRDRLLADNPFPGLRPFEYRDSDLFFGRDRQIEDIRARLSGNHFLAVIGVSGSGKSSLIRAGVIPILYQGFIHNSGSQWKIVLMRPGKAPIKHLAEELDREDVFGPETGSERLLNSGHRGLLSAARRLGSEENLLIVVDQFEEIFRYKDLSDASQQDSPIQAIAEADAFVGLLLNGLKDKRIYVVITMRSDFLGDCARFPLLAEHINRGQYLIPALSPSEQSSTSGDQRRMPSEQRQIIEFPIHSKGASISEPLISRLLGDLGSEPARLPVVQHALRQIWIAWTKHEEPARPIDVCDYNAVGGCSEAMNWHAAAAYDALPSEEHKRITKLLFQRITLGRDDGKVATRRPTELQDILAVVNANREEDRRQILVEVIAHYSDDLVAFLAKPQGKVVTDDRTPYSVQDHQIAESLNDESIIDITHESLCRQWTTLNSWVKDEVRSTWWYQRVTDSAFLEQKTNKKAPLADAELDTVLKEYLPEPDPIWTPAWSRRYNKHYQQVAEFIDYSKQERQKRKERRELQEQRDRDSALRQERDELELEAARMRAKQVELEAAKRVEEARVRAERAALELTRQREEERLLQQQRDRDSALRRQKDELELEAARMRAKQVELEAAKRVEEARVRAERAALELTRQREEEGLRAERAAFHAAKQAEQIAAATLKGRRQWFFFIACAVLLMLYLALLVYTEKGARERSTTGTVNTLVEHATGGPGTIAGDSKLEERRLDALAAYSLQPSNPLFTNVSWWQIFSPQIAHTFVLRRLIASNSSDHLAAHDKHTLLVLSPHDGSVAFASADHTLTLYRPADLSTATDSPSSTQRGKSLASGPTNALAFSSQGSYLAQGGDASLLKIYNLKNNAELPPVPSNQTVYALAFSPDERLLAIAGRSTLSMQEVPFGSGRRGKSYDVKLEHQTPVWMEFDRTGTDLLVAFGDGSLLLYRFDFEHRRIQLIGTQYLDQPFESAAFVDDGSRLVVGKADGSLSFFDTNQFELQTTTALPYPAFKMAFSPDGGELAIGTRSGSLFLYDAKGTGSTWQSNILMQAQLPGPIYKILFDNRSRFVSVAVGPLSPEMKAGSVSVIDAKGGQELSHLDYPSAVSEIINMPGSSSRLVFAAQDGSAGLMDVDKAVPPFNGDLRGGKLACNYSRPSIVAASATRGLWVYNCGSELHLRRPSASNGYSDSKVNLGAAPGDLEISSSGDLVAWTITKKVGQTELFVAKVPSETAPLVLLPAKQSCGGKGSNAVFGLDGKRVACITDKGVTEFQIATNGGKVVLTPSEFAMDLTGRVGQVAYGGGSTWAAFRTDETGNGHVDAVYEGSPLAFHATFKGDIEQVTAIGLSAKGPILAIVTDKGTRLYNLSTQTRAGEAKVKTISASGEGIWLNQDGRLVALGSGPSLRIYEVGDWSAVNENPKVIAQIDASKAIKDLAFDEQKHQITTLAFDSQTEVGIQQSYPTDPRAIAQNFCDTYTTAEEQREGKIHEHNYTDEEWQKANLVVDKWLFISRPDSFCPVAAK
jgi:WD40 repeat protein/energy-coupling factor transporter ATP-binding protein EcfA2